MGISIVIPFYNEEESARAVLEEILSLYPQEEIIAVDDGSTDQTRNIISQFEGVRTVYFEKNQGQSASILAGLSRATESLCVLLDGDGQNDPADIQNLVRHFHQTQADVVCGYRASRQDNWSRRASSKIANKVRRMIVRDGVRDTGCSLKVFRREAIGCLVPFNGMHRFLPAFFRASGFRIEEVRVNHRPRSLGTSKYTNWERGLRGIYDLIGVRWYLRRHVRPELSNEIHHERNPF